MQLTQHTDYAIRVLLYTAAHTERLVNITEISNFYQISRSHLAKVVASLTQKGYLIGVRGKNGGLKLGMPASSLNLGKLVSEFEPLNIVECFTQNNTCVITADCQLKQILYKAKEAFIEVLSHYSLADIQLPTQFDSSKASPLLLEVINHESST